MQEPPGRVEELCLGNGLEETCTPPAMADPVVILDSVAESHFDDWIARHYETLWPELFDPAVVEPVCDLLADLAGTGAAPRHTATCGPPSWTSWHASQGWCCETGGADGGVSPSRPTAVATSRSGRRRRNRPYGTVVGASHVVVRGGTLWRSNTVHF